MSYIGQQLPADTFSGFVTDSFTGDGSATTFNLSKAPFSEDTLIVVINNVIQKPTTNFTVSGTTLTIVGTALTSSDTGYAIHTGGPIPITTPGDNSVTSAKLSGNLVTPGTLDVNGQELILDADADTSITADTDDQIDIRIAGADDFQFTANTFTAQSGSTITTPTLGVINTKDLGAGIHIKTSDSGADVNSNYDELIIESSGTCGMSILAGASNYGGIMFGDSGANSDGQIYYDYANQEMSFVTAGSTRYKIRDTGSVHIDSAGESSGGGAEAYAAYITNAQASNANGIYNFFDGGAPDSGSVYFMVNQDTSANRCIILANGNVVNHDNSYGQISDERTKQNIVDAGSQWDDIKNLRVRKFKKKDDVRQYGEDKANVEIGLVAQEAETVSPGLIKNVNPSVADIKSDASFGTLYTSDDEETKGDNPTAKVGDIKETKEKVKSIAYSVLYMKAIKALQEAMAKIETLETKVKALEDA